MPSVDDIGPVVVYRQMDKQTETEHKTESQLNKYQSTIFCLTV